MSDLVTISSSVVSSVAALISALAAVATLNKEKKIPPAAGGIFRLIFLFIIFAVGIFILITYSIAYVQKEQKEEVPSPPIIRTVPPQ